MTRLLVCGSRDFGEHGIVHAVLEGLTFAYDIECVMQGGANGADSAAEFWTVGRKLDTVTFFADWERYGPAAGPLRNQRMLDKGRPDLVVAFINKPLAESKGTKNMVGLARDAGVKTIVVEVR